MNDNNLIFEPDDRLELDGSIKIESLDIDAKQGFVLSQVDGSVTVSDLKMIVRLPEKEFNEIVTKLITADILKIKDKTKSLSDRRTPPPSFAAGSADNMPIEERVRRLYLDLDFMNYYQLLKIPKSATPEDVKAAYHKLSRDYHPDRFFRGEDKEVRNRLQVIFARINEAYKNLSNNNARAEYDKNLGEFEIELKQVKDKATGETITIRAPTPPPKPLQNKIMSKNPFMDNVLKAKRLYEGALMEIKKRNYVSARQNLKIAASLDPFNKNIPETLTNIDKIESTEQARQYYESGLKLESEGNSKDASRLYREAMILDSENALYYNRLARVVLREENNAELARKLMKKAIEIEPKNADHYLVLGRAFVVSQQVQAAIAQFEKGLELEPSNKELQKDLKKAKKSVK